MGPLYINRSLEPVLTKAASEFPAVVLTGPRQSGKTTLLQHLFRKRFNYISLEPPDVRVAAAEDPRSFLKLHPPPAIFDEVQYAPHLLPYIKEIIDQDRGRTGQYLLTGSQNLLLAEKVTESLAGRAAILRLLPLSRREAEGNPGVNLAWESNRRASLPSPLSFDRLWRSFLRGGYPELVTHPTATSPYGMRATSDLSRTGRADASAGRRPFSVSEFPPFAGGPKRSAIEPDQSGSGPRGCGQHG